MIPTAATAVRRTPMRHATDSNIILAALEQTARYDVSTCGDIPTIIAGHWSAGNDATCDDPPISEQHAAGAPRPFTLSNLIAAAICAIWATVRETRAQRQRRRQASDIYEALRELDDNTLRDLGFDRSEITSVAAEACGAAERTRLRTLVMSHTLP